MNEQDRTGWKPVLRDGSTGFQPVLQPFDPDVDVEMRHRNLPHWRQPGATYFVTFRLADSLPQAKLAALRAEREQWLKRNPPPRPAAALAAYQALFSERIEQYLAAGYGACWLKRLDAADAVVGALAHFAGTRYTLGDYVVMPNHVHVLVTPFAGQELSAVLHSWKSYTSNQINQLVGRKGTLWQEESYDHIVRDEDELLAFRAYIAENPIKAGLRPGEYRLGP